jgi:hypothetical protein
MKKTVWEFDEEFRLEYFHESGEIWIRQDTRHDHGGRVHEIGLEDSDVSGMILALGELKAILDAARIAKIEGKLGEVA